MKQITYNQYKEELEDVLNKLSIENLKSFCRDILLEDDLKQSVIDKYHRNIKIVYFLINYMKARKLYNELMPNKQTDAAIVSVLLHNVYFDGDPKNWMDVFELRNKTMTLIEDFYNTPDVWDVIQYIYQVVEAQLGEEMPVPANRPVNGQITYIVWEVLWMYNHIDELTKINKE